MELIPILSTVLMGATLVTILFALFSYLAFRYREMKRPRPQAVAAAAEARFFRRYVPPAA